MNWEKGEKEEGKGRNDWMDGLDAWMRTNDRGSLVGYIVKGQEGREGKQSRECSPLLCMDGWDDRMEWTLYGLYGLDWMQMNGIAWHG